MEFGEEALKYLNLGIESELAAYVFYKRVMTMIPDESLRQLLTRLALDEKAHFLSLEDTYDRHVRSECWAPYKDIMTRPGLPDIDELVQETHKDLLGKISRLRTKKEVLEMALGLEKEAVTLYSGGAAKARNAEERKIFDYLTGFERGHVQIIEKELAGL